MDLFQLLGTISINNSKANQALDETSQAGQKAESKLGKSFKAVGNGAVAVGKTIATGMAAGAAAVGALVTKSIQSYADYEQLVGGVDTLFKESSAKVQEYAANAYKTAGLSANEYMETVTSFSASLLQSLEGDTNKAAEKANMAITDMSDNANKMGTDIAMIQNAYQGFAKQNYTMLDNLKLGYGGTKEEMARLLADAQALSGIEYDIDSYADVVDAIHVIQTEMGITGTTAKEASSTISGSLASMKSSWQNLLTAISADDLPFDTYVDNFVESVSTVAENLMPRIEIALNGVVKLIDKLAPVIMAKIPGLFSTLLPSIVQGATNLVKSLVDIFPGLVSTLTSMLPELVSGFSDIILSLFNGLESLAFDAGPQLVDGIVSAFEVLVDMIPWVISNILYAMAGLAPSIITGIISAISSIVSELPAIIDPLIFCIPWILEEIIRALLDNLPMLFGAISSMISTIFRNDFILWLLEVALELVTNVLTMLGEQLPLLLPLLIQSLMSLLMMVFQQIPVLLPVLLNGILTIISMLGEQLPVLLPMLIQMVISIIYLLIEQIPIITPMLISACITIIMAIIQALPGILSALTSALPALLQAVWDAIVMIFTNLPQWFGQIFQGAVDLIKAAWDVVAGFFGGIWDAICQVFEPVTQWFSDTFGGAWEAIQNVFEPVVNFFKVMFENAWKVVEVAWSVAKTFFSAIWQIIKAVFTPVVDFFKGVFQGAWDGIKKIFSAVGDFFGGIWNTIKDKFSSIGTKIGDAISGAVRGAINGLLGSAEKIINGFLGMINGAIDLINAIPGVNISKVKLVSFTRLAEGGVVDKATPAVFGEDGAEAVVPLEKNTGWLNKVAKQLHEFSLETKDDLSGILSTRSVDLQEQQVSEMQTLNSKIDSIMSLLVQFFPKMLEALNIQMYLDTGILVAESAPAMDAELGKIAIKKGRGR